MSVRVAFVNVVVTLAGALLCMGAAPAQVTSLDPPTPIDGEWRCRVGDDPAFALHDVDESAWQPITLPETSGPGPCFAADAWFRRTILVPAELRGEPLGVSLGEVAGAYQLFIDGVRVGGHGSLSPFTEGLREGKAFLVPSPLDDDGALVIALHVRVDLEAMTSAQSLLMVRGGPLIVGRMPSVSEHASTVVDAQVREATAAAVGMTGLFLFVALYHVLVWFMRRDQLAYLWFGVFCFLADAWLASITIAGTPLLPWSTREAASIGNLVGTLVNVAFIEFFFRFLDKTAPPKRWRIYEALLGVVSVLGFIPVVGVAATVTPPVILLKIAMPFLALVELGRAWRRGNRQARVLGAALLVGALAAPLQAFVLAKGIHLTVAPAHAVLAIFVLTMAVALAAQFARTLDDVDARARELAETNASIQRFVPTDFLSAIHKASVREVKRGDSAKTVMSVMFCDLRDFTTTSERLGPEETFRFINGYLERMEPEIHKTGGFINQYLGDGIMALFPRGADAAVDSAVGMCRALEQMNVERAGRGEPALRIGIGIHTGELMLGTIGGTDRLDAGVVGDVVNTAARLEGITKMYGALVLVSGATQAALQNPGRHDLRALDAVRAKGKSEPMPLVEVIDADPPALKHAKLETRSELEASLALYRAGRFDDAAAAFERLAVRCPDDGAARALADRCRAFMETPPQDWDGVLSLTKK